jgi:leucyl-tRNA synthetase
MMILANDMEKRKSISLSEYKIFVRLLAPFAPFVTEEIWHELGKHGSIHSHDWPFFDESKTLEDTITIAIQVNVKVRDSIEIERDLPEEDIKKEALEREVVKKWIDGKEMKKVIYVKNKILNIVV